MLRGGLAVTAAVLWLGCGGGTTAPASEVAYDFSFADPAGDTTAATANPGAVPAADLLVVSGTVDRDQVTIHLEFGSAVSRWSDAAPDALDGFIDFDLDQNGGTGTQVRDLGVDAFVDLRDNGSGLVAFVNRSTGKISLLPGRWDGTTFEVKVPRAELFFGADNDNKFSLLVETGGRGRRPDGDDAPNTGHFRVQPPAVPAVP